MKIKSKNKASPIQNGSFHELRKKVSFLVALSHFLLSGVHKLVNLSNPFIPSLVYLCRYFILGSALTCLMYMGMCPFDKPLFKGSSTAEETHLFHIMSLSLPSVFQFSKKICIFRFNSLRFWANFRQTLLF